MLHLRVFSEGLLARVTGASFRQVCHADLQSLDFNSNRLFMKLFRAGSKNVVTECRSYFGIELPT